MGPIEILEVVSFRVILKHYVVSDNVSLPFYWSWPRGWKKGQQNKTCTWDSTKLPRITFKRIAFKCSVNLYFYALIIGFFRSA